MERSRRERVVRSLRATAGGLALLLLIAAIVGPHWSRNLAVEPADRFVAGAIGFLLGAMAVLGPAFRRSYVATAVILLNSLVLLCVVELVVRAGDRLDDAPPTPSVKNAVLAALPFQKQHDVEFGETGAREFEPYALWRSKPYAGRTIRIGETGLRDTPGSHCTPDAYKIFTLGGSAMWGAGAADAQTIPAFLQEHLGHAGRPVCVTNYAEVGYVFGQNVAELVNLLLQGERPDLVISYDGYNDVYVAYEQGLVHHQFYYADMKRMYEPIEPHWYHNLAVYWRIHPAPPETYEWHDYSTMGKDADALSTEVANHYFNSYSVVEALAAKWHFDFALFIQPTISIGKKRLTKAEQPILTDLSEPLRRLTAGIYARLEAGAKERRRLFHLADVFDQTDGEIWFDPVHVDAEGNKIVAERIATILSNERIYRGGQDR
jgi:hypothetical protein